MPWNVNNFDENGLVKRSQALSGLDFPGNSGVTTTIRFNWVNPQNDGLTQTGSANGGNTYIWKAYYREQTATPGYFTCFFYTDDDNWFEGGGDSPGAGYGFHPYPVDATGNTSVNELSRHIFSIADGTDFPAGESNWADYLVTYDQWYTHVVRILYTNDEDITYEFYPDYDRDDTLVLSKRYGTGFDGGSRENQPVNPVLAVGDAPHSEGNEVMSGILRGFQFYNNDLSLAQIDSELANPGSVETPWYLKLNPTITDIADDSGNGHDPSWVGSERPSNWSG